MIICICRTHINIQIKSSSTGNSSPRANNVTPRDFISFTSKQSRGKIKIKRKKRGRERRENGRRPRSDERWPHCPASPTIGRPRPSPTTAAATIAAPTPTRHAAAAAGLPRRCWNWNAAVAGIRVSRLGGGGGADARGGTDGIWGRVEGPKPGLQDALRLRRGRRQQVRARARSIFLSLSAASLRACLLHTHGSFRVDFSLFHRNGC